MRRTIRLGVQTPATIMDRRGREALALDLIGPASLPIAARSGAAAITRELTLTRTFGCNSCGGKRHAIITSPAKLKPWNHLHSPMGMLVLQPEGKKRRQFLTKRPEKAAWSRKATSFVRPDFFNARPMKLLALRGDPSAA